MSEKPFITHCPDCRKQVTRPLDDDYCKGHWIKKENIKPTGESPTKTTSTNER